MVKYISQARRMMRKGYPIPPFGRLAADFGKWKKLMDGKVTSVEARLPWMTFSSIRFLEKNLDKSMQVFEYGCGGSTLFLVERAGKVVSVEHNKEWYEILSSKMKEKNFTNWEGLLIEPEYNGKPATSISDPDEYGTDDSGLSAYRFRKYASSIDKYDGFDWVLVDGRSRPSCLKHAIPKIKPGGFLLLDNSDRDYYLEKLPAGFDKRFRTVCDAAGPAPFMPEFSRTTIWQKNKS